MQARKKIILLYAGLGIYICCVLVFFFFLLQDNAHMALKTAVFGAPLLLLTALLACIIYYNLRRTLADLQNNYDAMTRTANEYRELSYIDMLTGLPNRRAFFENARQLIARTLRTGQPLFVMAVDIDHFKLVNDEWGHAAGDTVLVEFAHLMRDTMRLEDVVGRCGGEEFGIILPHTTWGGAHLAAERLRLACATHPYTLENGKVIKVTISIGLARLLNTGNRDADTVDRMLKEGIQHADAALYQAKRTGRNRVCCRDVNDVDTAVTPSFLDAR